MPNKAHHIKSRTLQAGGQGDKQAGRHAAHANHFFSSIVCVCVRACVCVAAEWSPPLGRDHVTFFTLSQKKVVAWKGGTD